MAQFKSYGMGFVFLALFLLFTSVYSIREGQHGLLLRLGRITVDPVTKEPDVKDPGLHFKIPFVHRARIFDTRLQTLDIKSSRIVTEEKKDVLVDYFVKWRIEELPLYFTRTGGNHFRAETLLEQKLNDGLRAEFGKRNISEVVSGERSDIMTILRNQAAESAKSLGIQVLDVRIKRIDLPTEVSTAVFERMRAERERIANEHRAEGRSKSEGIQAQADATVTVTLAKASSEAKITRGAGDAEAARIYAEAYNKNPEFYAFYRSLRAYKDIFKVNQDFVLLKPDSQFFKYFNQANAKG